MGEENGLAALGQKWSGWAKIFGTVIALVALFGGGTLFYNEVWQSKELVYTLLPAYDLSPEHFSGVVIENRGRALLTNVQIIVTDLDTTIEVLNMPGAHEPARVTEGGEGEKHMVIEMLRLSPGTSLPIYMLTRGPIKLDQDNVLVTSTQTTGKASSESGDNLLAIILAASLVLGATSYFYTRTKMLAEMVDKLAMELSRQ